MYKFQPDYIQTTHTHTHTHFLSLSFCNQISYLISHFLLSITDKSNENDDHTVALSELPEDFCKQNERIEVSKFSELQDLLNMDVPIEIGKAKFHMSIMQKVTPSYS